MKELGVTAKNTFAIAMVTLIIPTQACKCESPGSIRNRIEYAGLTFYGKAISVVLDSSTRMAVTHFSIEEKWENGKRVLDKTVAVESKGFGSGCEAKFQVGVPAIVFASRQVGTTRYAFETNLCMGNIVSPSQQQIDTFYKIRGSRYKIGENTEPQDERFILKGDTLQISLSYSNTKYDSSAFTISENRDSLIIEHNLLGRAERMRQDYRLKTHAIHWMKKAFIVKIEVSENGKLWRTQLREKVYAKTTK